MATVVGLFIALATSSAASVQGYWVAASTGTNEPAYKAAASLVSTPSGVQVLAAGGQQPFVGYVNTTKLLNPATGVWATAAPMHHIRYDAATVTLNDGRVLVIGGEVPVQPGADTPTTIEVFDGMTDSWSTAIPLPGDHDGAAVVKLLDGRILIAGGGKAFTVASTTQTLIFNPVDETIVATGSLHDARMAAAGALLADGRVLVTGGWASNIDALASTEIYDPVSGIWTLAGPMNVARHFQTPGNVQLLSNGKVLAVGGINNGVGASGNPRSAEVYDPTTNVWGMTSPMPNEEQTSTVGTLASGAVLQTAVRSGLASIYDPSAETWTSAPAEISPNGRGVQNFGAGVLLPDNSLLVTVGTTFTNYPAVSVRYVTGIAPADTTAPTTPAEFQGEASQYGIFLSWAPSFDEYGIAGYDIYRDGKLIGTTIEAAFFDQNLAASTSYTYAVRARDLTGNISPLSAQLVITTLPPAPDTTPPSQPTEVAATVNNTGVMVTWTASTDDTGVYRYQVYRDGSLLGVIGRTSYRDTTAAAGTTYSYTVIATDAVGNASDLSAPAIVTTPSGPGGGVDGGTTPSGRPLPAQACQHAPRLCS